MLGWIGKGLRTGVVTTRYPHAVPFFQGRTVPIIDTALLRSEDCAALALACPTGALSCRVTPNAYELVLDLAACISCGMCARARPGTVTMTDDIQLAARHLEDLRTTYLLPVSSDGG